MEFSIGYAKGSMTFTDLQKQFAQIPVELQAHTYITAGAKYEKLVGQIARATSPHDKRSWKISGRYRDSLKVIKGDARKRGRGRRGGLYRAARRIGPDATLRNFSPHASLVEFGSVERMTRAGKRTGRMPAYHVLGNASEVTASKASGFYKREIRLAMKRINRELKSGKLSKRTGRALAGLV